MSGRIAWLRVFPCSPRWGTFGKVLYHGVVQKDEIVVSSRNLPLAFHVAGSVWVSDEGHERACRAGFDASTWERSSIGWCCDIPWQEWTEAESRQHTPIDEPERVFRSRRWPRQRVSLPAWRLLPTSTVDVLYEFVSAEMFAPTHDYAQVAGEGMICASGVMRFPSADPEHSLLLSVPAWEWLQAACQGWFRCEEIWLGPRT